MTFSRLTLGEPRLKSKLRGGSVDLSTACEEPLTTGVNIFPYSDFEDVLTQQGGGPNGNEIPYRSNGFRWPSEYDSNTNTHGDVIEGGEFKGGVTDPFHICNNSAPFEAGHWYISTTNPDTGTYHAQLDHTDGSINSLVLFRLTPCNEGAPIHNFRGLGGQIVTVNWRAAGEGNGQPRGGPGFAYYDQDNNFITSTGTLNQDLTSNYNSYQESVVLPSGTWFWTLGYFSNISLVQNPTGTVVLDNLTVALE